MYLEIKKVALRVSLVSLLSVFPLLVGSSPLEAPNTIGPVAAATPSERSSFPGYKGVMVGATATDVRTKLGNPRDKSDEMDLYVFSDSESAQFYYNGTHVVTAIMITYSGDLKVAPTPRDIFGEDAAPKPDGGIFKMVRYPKSGFWISYNRTAGDDAVISIAVQKI